MTTIDTAHDIPASTAGTTGTAGTPSTTVPPRPDWAALDAATTGRLVLPDAPDFDAQRRGWLVNIDQRPAAILHVADEADVATAVRWAAVNGVPVAAQPRGHAARTTLDGTLLLRLGALTGIEIDPTCRIATIGAGVRSGDLLAALEGTGLIALTGSNADPTALGAALGGGMGWFGRMYGFAANSVLSFAVVDATGAVRRVDSAADPDLFWALRGGGGDFAIVTSAEVALYPEPLLYGGRLVFPAEHAAPVLRAFRDLTARAPRELSCWATIMHVPDLPALPTEMRGASFVMVAAVYLGAAEAAEEWLAELRAAAPVIMDAVGPLTVGQIADVAGEPVDPMPALDYAAILTGLPDEGIDGFVALAGNRDATPLMVAQIRHLEGALGETREGQGAVCPADGPYSLFLAGIGLPELAEPLLRAFTAAQVSLGHLMTGRFLPNFSGEQQDDAHGYDADTLARLRRIKAERDPDGVIRSNKPVSGR